MTTVTTPQGDVNLNPPTIPLLEAIRAFLPFGIVRYSAPLRGADYGLVMQCGEQELYGVKQQPVDCGEEQAMVNYQAHSVLIAHALAGYLQNGFTGLWMPCGYRRKREGGLVESGIAYFGCPSQRGRESQEYPYEPAYDRQFGHGFTTMMTSFIRALQQSSAETHITMAQSIGLDVRPRLALGSLGTGWMVVGPHVVSLKTAIVPEQDPTWAALRSTGITDVFHLPSVPAAIEESDLPTAKGGASG